MKIFSLLFSIISIILSLCVLAGASFTYAQQQQQASSWCDQSVGVSTYLGATSRGSLGTSSISQRCSLPQYVTVPGQTPKGSFNFNLKGDYVYVAPSTGADTNDVIFVDVFCFDNQGQTTPLCRQTFVAQVSAPFTLAPPTSPGDNGGAVTTAAPASEVPTCPVVYHFTATTGTVLSASLRTAVGQPSCPYGQWFQVGRQPNFGSINLVANGDFSYTSPGQQTWDDFGYTLYCFNDILCKGSAYVLVSGTAAPATTVAPSSGNGGNNNGGGNTGGGNVIKNPSITCAGSCVDDSWKATPDSPPYSWDNNAIRTSDGLRVGTVRANYDNGSIVLSIFGKVGNLGQRFPTFEPIPFRSGETLSAQNILNRVSSSSLGFSVDCLARQPTSGMGEEVWHWKSLINRTGELGPYHATQNSWYQKFGGAHQQCDTLVDSCTFAPLLTPNAQQDPTKGGVWSVNINGCDITWTGRFSLAAIRSMKTKSGASVWTVADGRTVRTTLYLQAIQPTSWLQPIMGYETDLIAKPLVLTLDPDVSVELDSSAAKLFSVDGQFRPVRVADTGDYGFELDLRVYPHIVTGATSSYRADRHISGFRWIEQKWTTPDTAGCRSCVGTESICNSNPRAPTATFFSADQSSTCSNPIVVVSKGPSMTTNDCIHNLMYIYNRPGLSAPSTCATNFQNLTVRGVVPGSHASSSFFGFEGTITLQLILDTGITVVVRVQISRFVSMMSVDGRGVTGRTVTCRGTEYWPVLDPLGTSLPNSPYFLSGAATEALTSGTYLCASHSRFVGPTSWATVLLDIDNQRDVLIESLSIEFADPRFDETVYFLARDPITGRNTQTLDGTKSVWWTKKYPFFNFRDLSPLLDKFNHSSRAINTPDNEKFPPFPGSNEIDFAIAFTPGTLGITTKAILTFRVRNKNPDGSLGDGHVTLRTLIHLDKTLADRDIEGIRNTAIETFNEGGNPNTLLMIYGVTGGLIVGVIFLLVVYVSVDHSAPLPTWIPNAHELRNVILASAGAVFNVQSPTVEKPTNSNKRSVDGVAIPTIGE